MVQNSNLVNIKIGLECIINAQKMKECIMHNKCKKNAVNCGNVETGLYNILFNILYIHKTIHNT